MATHFFLSILIRPYPLFQNAKVNSPSTLRSPKFTKPRPKQNSTLVLLSLSLPKRKKLPGSAAQRKICEPTAQSPISRANRLTTQRQMQQRRDSRALCSPQRRPPIGSCCAWLVFRCALGPLVNALQVRARMRCRTTALLVPRSFLLRGGPADLNTGQVCVCRLGWVCGWCFPAVSFVFADGFYVEAGFFPF